MRKLIIILILMIAGTNLVYAGHDDDRGAYDNIVRAAHRLENAAGHFQEQLKYDVGRDHATRDARLFARSARHFHRLVERGGSYPLICSGYLELVRAYAHVRNEFGERRDLRHDRHLGRDFGEVERAFNRLDRTIWNTERHYPFGLSHHRYGRQDSSFNINFRGNFGS